MKALPLALLASAALLAGGCRVKAVESFLQATTPQDNGYHYGDPYSYGGYALSSGGLNPDTHYGDGARRGPGAQPNVGYDMPAKGSGLQPGENPAEGKPWWATQNAPAWQVKPENIDADGTRVPK